ncbi:uncharacterized protein V1516DRAFT_627459 [Lipomyces oligophaga]|uniref:uncharacterized protein n=1 Tax=Lipomyces oligophaga TaxID=45792 RepID=UPI0034CFEEED
MITILIFAVLLFCGRPVAAANSAFCKCTCFSNSTLIHMPEEYSSMKGCLECTRKFCLDYNLPICKDAQEKDTSATCYQRDSAKDETVVIMFIVITGGLLAWAGFKIIRERIRRVSLLLVSV